MRSIAFLFLLITSVSCAHQGAQYLNKAVRDLRQLNIYQTLRRADVDMVSSSTEEDREVPSEDLTSRRDTNNNEKVPPLSLTKSELASLYQSAVSKGETLKLGTGDDSYIHAAVHEIEDGSPSNNHNGETPASTSEDSGYYYYYYPIKSFIDELTSQAGSDKDYSHKHKPEARRPKPVPTTERPPYQFHSHHHQHNITINKNAPEEKKPSKSLEPLFMAISGFIGMAVMLLFSVVVMPKLNAKPTTKHRIWKQDEDDIENFSRLALRAIDGESCAERFACELSQTAARAFGIQNNRFVKLFRRLAPSVFRRNVDPAAKYRYKEIKCTAIPCKKKNNNFNNNKNNANRNNKNKVKNKNPKQKKT